MDPVCRQYGYDESLQAQLSHVPSGTTVRRVRPAAPPSPKPPACADEPPYATMNDVAALRALCDALATEQRRLRSSILWMGFGGLAIIVVILLVLILVFALRRDTPAPSPSPYVIHHPPHPVYASPPSFAPPMPMSMPTHSPSASPDIRRLVAATRVSPSKKDV